MAARKKRVLTPEEQLEAALVPESEWPYDVPDNWCWIHWGSAGEFVAGNAFKNAFQGFTDYEIPFYKVGSLKYADSDGYLYDTSNTINNDIRSKLKASLIPPNSILFAKIGEAIRLNRRRLNSVPCCIDNNMMAFVARVCDYRYAYYWSQHIDMYELTNATTVPAIRKTDLEAVPFPLPPLCEQRRIASRIEWLFAKLDDAEAKLRDVINSSEQRQAAILCQALNGGVTKSWRVRNGVDRAATWKECRLIDALKGKPRNGYSPKPVDYETPVKNLVLTAVTSGTFKSAYFKYIDEEIPDDSHLWLTPGDILLQRSNSLEKVGTSALYTGKPREFVYPDLMMKLQANDTAYAPFIAYQLKSFGVMNYLRSNATGTAGNMPKVNQVTVSNIPIVLPSYQEQVEIAESLDYLLSREMALVDDVSAVLDDLKNMRMIILSRALRGELGTNDPDEPSSKELLASVFEREA